jgi:cob(I)alamin adenosyltransferase
MLLCIGMLTQTAGWRKVVARIYTRTGDDGTTDLIGRQRVPKDSPLIEAIGTLDELNAHLGIVRSYPLPDQVDSVLQVVQEQLFLIGAEIATPAETENRTATIGEEAVRNLEGLIDSYESSLTPLKKFILPGGAPAGAHLHLARAVTRRIERQCVALFRSGRVNPEILRFLNRLSDLCFVLARYVNCRQSISEKHPATKKL